MADLLWRHSMAESSLTSQLAYLFLTSPHGDPYLTSPHCKILWRHNIVDSSDVTTSWNPLTSPHREFFWGHHIVDPFWRHNIGEPSDVTTSRILLSYFFCFFLVHPLQLWRNWSSNNYGLSPPLDSLHKERNVLNYVSTSVAQEMPAPDPHPLRWGI